MADDMNGKKKLAEKKLLIAIPAYNCAEQIVRVLNQITPEYSEFVDEVLVIDNQSTDETINRAVKKVSLMSHLKMTVVRNLENFNLGGSHKVAFQYCEDNGYGGVIILHGDDQGSLLDFYPLLKSQRYLKFDCVLGARFKRESKLTGYSVFRVIGNRVFNILYSLAVFSRVYDMGSGLNLYMAPIIRSNFFRFMPDDLTFNNCMLLASYSHRQRIHFEPISWREEDQISNAKLFSQSKKLISYLLSPGFRKDVA